jgi:hypothetical protein
MDVILLFVVPEPLIHPEILLYVNRWTIKDNPVCYLVRESYRQEGHTQPFNQ